MRQKCAPLEFTTKEGSAARLKLSRRSMKLSRTSKAFLLDASNSFIIPKRERTGGGEERAAIGSHIKAGVLLVLRQQPTTELRLFPGGNLWVRRHLHFFRLLILGLEFGLGFLSAAFSAEAKFRQKESCHCDCLIGGAAVVARRSDRSSILLFFFLLKFLVEV
ncbi:hypothetical protein ACJIZ3_012434 [Penstemon smallii]|uniref:Uncharacterized protein n=1 Tax=Penstemon smallii TaxID=265156 RepID=A0ABD3UQN7_9LAMI